MFFFDLSFFMEFMNRIDDVIEEERDVLYREEYKYWTQKSEIAKEACSWTSSCCGHKQEFQSTS